MELSVTTGIDWFELDGNVDFDGVTASLPSLLKALRNNEKYVRLDDGTQGMLPEEWLKKYGTLADLGQPDEGKLKFAPSQALLLDALLAAQDDVQVDERFDEYRRKLRSFEGMRTVTAPESFTGTLRRYQQEGLGWLNFLREFRFGGCLADDMGLGKTIQVLALLEARRTELLPEGQTRKPSLVVVPKSLVFNWIDEAARFTPQLRVLDYTGWTGPRCASSLPTTIWSSPPTAFCGGTSSNCARSPSITRSWTNPRRSRTPTPRRPRRPGCCRPITVWP